MAKKAEAEDQGAGFEDDAPAGSGGVVVDLSQVDEDGDRVVIPAGMYNCVVTNVEFKYSNSAGNPMWAWQLQVEDGDQAGQTLFAHTTFTEKSMPRAKRTLSRVAPELLEGPMDVEAIANEGVLIDKRVGAKVEIGRYEGKPSNSVRDLFAPTDGGDGFLNA